MDNWLVITFSFDGATVAGIIQESGDEIVHKGWGCPNCGNRWIETLEILELPDDTPGTYDLVKCLVCGHEYKID